MARIILPPQQEESEKPWQRGSSRPELDLTHSVQLYPRVSTKEQLKNISAEMQQDKSFARDYGWTDAQIIMDPADLGKSGQLRMDERSAFLGMLGRIRNGIVKTVIAAQVDRFFREKWGVEYGKFMQICCEYNVKVVILTHDRRNTIFPFPGILTSSGESVNKHTDTLSGMWGECMAHEMNSNGQESGRAGALRLATSPTTGNTLTAS